MSTLVTGKTVRLDDQYLHDELADDRIISTPLNWYRELQSADEQSRNYHRFICDGTGIEWPSLDYQLSIESMLVNVPHQQAA